MYFVCIMYTAIDFIGQMSNAEHIQTTWKYLAQIYVCGSLLEAIKPKIMNSPTSNKYFICEEKKLNKGLGCCCFFAFIFFPPEITYSSYMLSKWPSYHCNSLLFKSTVCGHCNVLDRSFTYSANLWFKTGGKIFSMIQILECLFCCSFVNSIFC